MLKKRLFEISADGVKQREWNPDFYLKPEKKTLYFYDIICESREEIPLLLSGFSLDEDITEGVAEPEEHIRFKIIKQNAYGELAFFNAQSDSTVTYIGVISNKNALIVIHEETKELSKEVVEELSEAAEHNPDKLSSELVLYILIHEILTYYGKLIIDYRKDIEALAKELDYDDNEIDPEQLLAAKTKLSQFSMIFEKMFFTLNFPPAKNLLDKESNYNVYFKDLLKNLEILKLSLSQTEARLQALHQHSQLIIQDKTNKRINFLTILQAIFVPLTLVVGIYGMNFQNMPELATQYGYFITIAGMVVVAAGFIWYFKKSGWFE